MPISGIASAFPTSRFFSARRRPYAQIAQSATGTNPVFSNPNNRLSYQPVLPPINSSDQNTPLPRDYGFPELAEYEEARRRQFGGQSEQDILGYGRQVGQMGQDLRSQIERNQARIPGFFEQGTGRLSADAQALENQLRANQSASLGFFEQGTGRLSTDAQTLQNQLRANAEARRRSVEGYAGEFSARGRTRREELARTLADIGQKQFATANPFILEDLNRRGVFSSPTANAQEQGRFLRDIALENQRQILEREGQDIGREEELRRLGLDQSLTGEDSNVARDVFGRRQALSQGLLQQQLAGSGELSNLGRDVFGRRQDLSRGLLESQIQGVGDLSALDRDLFGRQADIRGTGLQARLQAEQDALDSGLDLRRGELERQMAERQASQEESLARDLANQRRRQGITESLIGAGGSIGGGLLAGKLLGGGAAAAGGAAGLGPILPIAAIGGGAYLASKALGKTKIGKKIEPIVNPVKAVSSISKAVKKYCFDGNTPIEMKNGKEVPISQLSIGDETKGGVVESVRHAKTEEGTRYIYKGICVTGSHAVKEDGRWIRVENSPHATLRKGGGLVWSIITDKHRIYVNGTQFADEIETDNYEDLTINQSLDALNKQSLMEVV